MSKGRNKYALLPVCRKHGTECEDRRCPGRVPNVRIRNGQYYLEARRNGTRYCRVSPWPTQLAKTETWARQFLAKAEAGRWEDQQTIQKSKARNPYPTLGRVFDEYRSAAKMQYMLDGKPLAKTVENNILALALIVRRVKGVENVAKLSTAVLTKEVAERYVALVMADAAGDYTQEHRLRVTATSTLQQAKSVFTKWARIKYEGKMVLPPEIDGFLKASKRSKSKAYAIPPDALLHATIRGLAELKEKQPELYRVFILAGACGMRASAVIQARREWLETDEDGHTEIVVTERPYFRPKNWNTRPRPRRIPVPDEMATFLLAGAEPGPLGFLLPAANKTERNNLIKRQFAAWMRTIGWDNDTYKKAAHELRKLAGAVWYTQYGLEKASRWLGDTAATVDHYYSDLVSRNTIDQLELLFAKPHRSLKLAAPKRTERAPARYAAGI